MGVLGRRRRRRGIVNPVIVRAGPQTAFMALHATCDAASRAARPQWFPRRYRPQRRRHEHVFRHDRRRHRLDDARLGGRARRPRDLPEDLVAGRLAPTLNVRVVRRCAAQDGPRVDLGRQWREDAAVPEDAVRAPVLVGVPPGAHRRRRVEGREAAGAGDGLPGDRLAVDNLGDEGGHGELNVELDRVGKRCELHISGDASALVLLAVGRWCHFRTEGNVAARATKDVNSQVYLHVMVG